MRTTIWINEDLLKWAKRRETDEGRTLTSLVEEGLALIRAKPKGRGRKWVEIPVSKANGGLLPRVDLNRSGDLEQVMNAQ